jgi:hypothetical protein
MAKSVWALVDDELLDHMIACTHENTRLWVVEMQESTSSQEFEFVKLLVTLLSIWWARKKVIHEEQY